VCGLETLTQLEWLDLSFNNIEEISGLEKLASLRDLSLANNRLKTLSNLDSMAGSLQILSVANNLIEEKKYVSKNCSHKDTPFCLLISLASPFPPEILCTLEATVDCLQTTVQCG
jgi:Leucine-rich repeat (LRR) protein